MGRTQGTSDTGAMIGLPAGRRDGTALCAKCRIHRGQRGAVFMSFITEDLPLFCSAFSSHHEFTFAENCLRNSYDRKTCT